MPAERPPDRLAEPHVPVLLDRVVELLHPRPGETYVDCTAGLGGHASAIASRLAPGGTVVLADQDRANLERATERVRRAGGDGVTVVAIPGNFAELPRRLAEAGTRADMVLADLGFASNQVDDPGRGLSFRRDGPLDMRLDPSQPVTASELVNTLPERELADLIWRYGEERHARRIARKLVEARAGGPMTTTAQLAEAVRAACPPVRGPSRIDPATRTFQAIRIAVNDEIGSLEALLEAVRRDASKGEGGRTWLRSGARVAIIAFHSLEDRPVKRAMADLVARDLGVALTRKAATADEPEFRQNPRARSARLRAIRLSG